MADATVSNTVGATRAGSSPAPGTRFKRSTIGADLALGVRCGCVEARGVARSIWKGAITFGMVTIPVRLFPATQEKDVSFHLLHAPDHSRIKFKRFCETEDREVPN